MRLFYFVLPLLFLSVACVPSKSLIDLTEENKLTEFNTLVQGKAVTLRLVNGEVYKPNRVLFFEDSVQFDVNWKSQVIPISQVRSVTLSKQPSIAKIVALSVFALGVYSLVYGSEVQSLGEVYVRLFSSALIIASSPFIYVIGSTAESKTYYFDEYRFNEKKQSI